MKQNQLQRKKNGIFRRTARTVGKALMVPLTAGLLMLGPKADAKPRVPQGKPIAGTAVFSGKATGCDLEKKECNVRVKKGDFVFRFELLTEKAGHFGLKVLNVDKKGVTFDLQMEIFMSEQMTGKFRVNYDGTVSPRLKRKVGISNIMKALKVERTRNMNVAKVTLRKGFGISDLWGTKKTTKAKSGEANPITQMFEKTKDLVVPTLMYPGCKTPKGVSSGNLAVGQEMWFGISWRAMYKMKITKITKDKVTYDLSMPFGSSTPGVNIVSYTTKFNGIEAPRTAVEKIAGILCTNGSGAGPKILSVNGAHKLMSTIVKGLFENLSVSGEAILIDTTGFKGSLAPLKVKVVGKNKKEFKLRVKAKGTNPIVVRLDRSITQNVEFLARNPGLIATPLKIASLSIDSKGRVRGKLKPDCSKNIHQELFMSEIVSGKHPNCSNK
jgi:hypothetical protein